MKVDITLSLFMTYLISQLQGEWFVDGVGRWLLLAGIFGCLLFTLRAIKGNANE